MRGAPIDLRPFGAALAAIGWLYWLLAIAGLGWALWGGSPWKTKLLRALPVVLLFGFFPGQWAWKAFQHKLRVDAATARFKERCATAGDKIHRTVDDVDGVTLLKLRPSKSHADEVDPMWPGAAFGSEAAGKEYIESFLLYEWRGQGYESRRGNVNTGPTSRPGYRYVDVVDPIDQRRYRYTIKFEPLKRPADAGIRGHELMRSETNAPPARYAVTFEDIVDAADRKHWIAGSTIRVIDQQSQEVIAEQTRFLMDTGFGRTGGSRSPWGWAASYGPRCPETQGNLGSKTRFFVDQVLRPKQRDEHGN